MIEIELPCCDASVQVEDLAEPVVCPGCGVTVELAPDPIPADRQPALLPAAA
jgi:hypothetical protein